ncbi:hypothetical protein ACFQY5_34200 [Paeniroseomonas aquatica]|uniref:hypothetical protein n=1 Tax=Paeniroseomonas aquatica TaxID=373043 RepID=UPI00360E9142
METFELLLTLLGACVALAVLARALDLPLAVTLVLGGMGIAFIPGLPSLVLDPSWCWRCSCRRCCRSAPTAPTGRPSATTSGPS